MRKILTALLIAVIFSSCEKSPTVISTDTKTSTEGTLNIQYGMFGSSYTIHEFEYKGHTYVGIDVKNGVAPTHAGHCWCNPCKTK